jgi:hypothetical protein
MSDGTQAPRLVQVERMLGKSQVEVGAYLTGIPGDDPACVAHLPICRRSLRG